MSDEKSRYVFEVGDLVIHKHTGARGIVVADCWGACLENEVPVHYVDSDIAYVGIDWSLLEKPLMN